jgi:hypothetical protein
MTALEEKATNRCGSQREDDDCAGSDARSLRSRTHEGMITVNMAIDSDCTEIDSLLGQFFRKITDFTLLICLQFILAPHLEIFDEI